MHFLLNPFSDSLNDGNSVPTRPLEMTTVMVMVKVELGLVVTSDAPVCGCRRPSREGAMFHPGGRRAAFEESEGIELRCHKHATSDVPEYVLTFTRIF